MTRNLVRSGLYLVIGYSILGLTGSAQAQSKEYIRVGGRVVAIESTASVNTACAATPTALPFRGTGTATGTGVVSNGTVDPNWKLVSNPGSYGGSSTSDTIAFASSYGGSTANSKPINPIGSDGALLAGAYVFRQKLDLSCHNPSTVSITGTVQADDNIQIYVNGKFQSTPPANWYTSVAFTIGGGGGAFVQGWNQVDFVVTNIGDPGNNPSMLRVDVTAASATVDITSNGLKFELTTTPPGGNRSGTTNVTLSSGSQPVTWAMEAPVQGSLNSAASTTVTYAGPGTLTNLTVGIVKATSTTGNPVKTGFFPIWMNPGAGGSVTISGTTTTLAPYTTRPFSATVSGMPAGQDTIRWSVVSVPATSSSNGLISTGTTCVAAPASMTYRAPSTITTSGSIVLKAESCSNPSLGSTISIPASVASSVTVSLTPTPSAIPNTAPQQFTATVSNADNSTVTWSPTSSAAGTLTQSGLFTPAPGYNGSASVRATSNDNSSIFSNHPFSVGSSVSISLSSSGASQTVLNNGTANFPITYTSSGTTGQVAFSVLNAPAGTNININPPSVTNQGTASITASVSPSGAAPGTYNLTFRATNGTITTTQALTLNVISCGTITVAPTNVTVYPFQQANFTAFRTGPAASHGVTWLKNTSAGSFGSALNPPTVLDPQISYFAADPNAQPQTVTITARSDAPGCSALESTATVTKATYVPNGLSLLYTNPLSVSVPRNLSRFFDYGAASQNGAGTVRFIQLELRNNLGETYDSATACAINFETTTNNNDPNALTSYALAKVANNAAAGGSADSTAIVPRGGSGSTQVVGTSSLWNCELDGTGSDYVRSGNIFALHMKVRMKSTVFSPGTIHVYVRSYGMDLYEPAIRQYMGSFTATN